MLRYCTNCLPLLLLDFNPDHLAVDLNGLGVVDVEVVRAGPGGDGEAGGCWSIVVMCRSPESVTSLWAVSAGEEALLR